MALQPAPLPSGSSSTVTFSQLRANYAMLRDAIECNGELFRILQSSNPVLVPSHAASPAASSGAAVFSPFSHVATAFAIALPSDGSLSTAPRDHRGRLTADVIRAHVLARSTPSSMGTWRVLYTNDKVVVDARSDDQAIMTVYRAGHSGNPAVCRVFGQLVVRVTSGQENEVPAASDDCCGTLCVMLVASSLYAAWPPPQHGLLLRDGSSSNLSDMFEGSLKRDIQDWWEVSSPGMPEGAAAAPRPTEPPTPLVCLHMRCRALLLAVHPRAARPILENLDVECLLFLSGYVCVRGFESFTVARVQQIINDATDRMMEAATSTGTTVQEDRELYASAVHVLVMHALAPLLLAHWRVCHAADDMDFLERSAAYRRGVMAASQRTTTAAATLMACSPCSFGYRGVFDARLKQAVVGIRPCVRCLDMELSPYALMRVAHMALEQLVASLKGAVDLTADDLLPIVAYALVDSQAAYVPSTIAYARAFSLPHVDLSAVGYSFTTLEAATQLLCMQPCPTD